MASYISMSLSGISHLNCFLHTSYVYASYHASVTNLYVHGVLIKILLFVHIYTIHANYTSSYNL